MISQTCQIVGSWDFKVVRLAVALPYAALCAILAFSHIKCQHLQSDATCQFAFQESTLKVNKHDSCDPKVDHVEQQNCFAFQSAHCKWIVDRP